jgi:ribosomal protein S18 acetylase RimI-like enzyme
MNKQNKSLTIQIHRAGPDDRDAVLAMLKKTEFFRPEELIIAQEVFDDAIACGPEGDYQSFVAREKNKTIGWICFGLTPCTVGTYNIYWVVVNPDNQNQGIGAALMQFATTAIKNSKGRIIVVDTSGTERYISTCRFYEKLGYSVEHRIKDFYTIGEDMVIYIKRL